MQSRAVASKSASRLFSAVAHKELPFWARTSHTADPAIQSQDPDGIEGEEAKKAKAVEEEQKQINRSSSSDREEIIITKPTPMASSPSLTSTEVSRADPLVHQKRSLNSNNRAVSPSVLDFEVSCVGVDGTPLPNKEGEEEDDSRDYYKEHKPSALSNIEMVDTRKPITRATDGTVTNYYKGYGGETMVWESADETLERAVRMWREAAMRAWDPDAPHSRALREALRARGEQVIGL